MPYIADPNPKIEQYSHATGTMIAIKGGKKPVEELCVGDLVKTKDNGYQPVRWVGARRLGRLAFKSDPNLRPIRIKAGALGENKPQSDLIVSQQHCVLLDDWRCELLFGEEEVLAPARALLNDSTVTIDRTSGKVTYYHFMFDQHEIVYSNGVETESFHPSAGGLDALDEAKRDEVFKLFPDLEVDEASFGPKARATLRPYEVEMLMAL